MIIVDDWLVLIAVVWLAATVAGLTRAAVAPAKSGR